MWMPPAAERENSTYSYFLLLLQYLTIKPKSKTVPTITPQFTSNQIHLFYYVFNKSYELLYFPTLYIHKLQWKWSNTLFPHIIGSRPRLTIRGQGITALRSIMGKCQLQPILPQKFWFKERLQKQQPRESPDGYIQHLRSISSFIWQNYKTEHVPVLFRLWLDKIIQISQEVALLCHDPYISRGYSRVELGERAYSCFTVLLIQPR